MSAPSIDTMMRLAIEQANTVKGTTYPNPPVGAVIVDHDGQVAGVGATQPPGGPHAEVMALRRAGTRAAGGTAVVTLEPCNHQGRTGPCVDALLDAGVAAVVFAVSDLNPVAAGGAQRLTDAGVTVSSGVLADEVCGGPLREWLHRQRTGRPHVTWKFGASIDGRSAAADGTSQWITGAAARADVHRHRAVADAIVVGTGTVLADDPTLTARLPDGTLAARQPLRVVVGEREISSESNILNDDSRTMVIRTHDPHPIDEFPHGSFRRRVGRTRCTTLSQQSQQAQTNDDEPSLEAKTKLREKNHRHQPGAGLSRAPMRRNAS